MKSPLLDFMFLWEGYPWSDIEALQNSIYLRKSEKENSGYGRLYIHYKYSQ